MSRNNVKDGSPGKTPVVTSYADVWVEITSQISSSDKGWVTSYADVWVEIAWPLAPFIKLSSYILCRCMSRNMKQMMLLALNLMLHLIQMYE